MRETLSICIIEQLKRFDEDAAGQPCEKEGERKRLRFWREVNGKYYVRLYYGARLLVNDAVAVDTLAQVKEVLNIFKKSCDNGEFDEMIAEMQKNAKPRKKKEKVQEEAVQEEEVI